MDLPRSSAMSQAFVAKRSRGVVAVMEWLRRLSGIGTRQGTTIASSHDPGRVPDALTYDEAKNLAHAEGKRILQADHRAVRYVRFDEVFFKDYCRVDITFDEHRGGLKRLVLLPLAERR